ncbi:MAG TPA: hypothetical protein VKV77_11240 [Methylovirgula sp.]|nr:hypothetical protein [Methylovirgula sp.]
MKLRETAIRGETVRLLYADAPTKDEASEWVELQMKLEGDDNRRLGVIQKAALLRLRALIDEEMTRFGRLSDQIREQPP